MAMGVDVIALVGGKEGEGRVVLDQLIVKVR
jgi:hypothetical protein